MESIFDELVDSTAKAGDYLVTGPAGTGKTTLLRSLAFQIAESYELTVLVHIPSTPLDTRFIRPLVDSRSPKRIVILINHASERITDIGYFVDDLRRYSMPVTILLEERKNQWNAAQQYLNTNFVKEEFELGSLSDQEIERILLALSKHNALGRLEGSSIEQQKSHFEKLAHKELLVALRELTSGTSFDNIIETSLKKYHRLLPVGHT